MPARNLAIASLAAMFCVAPLSLRRAPYRYDACLGEWKVARRAGDQVMGFEQAIDGGF